MSDQFDKKLIGRINEVFDSYEDDSANEGWQELRKGFPGKNKRGAFVWWYSSAAAILLFGGLWLTLRPEVNENTVNQITKKQEAGTIAEEPSGIINRATEDIETSRITLAENVKAPKKSATTIRYGVTIKKQNDDEQATVKTRKESAAQHDLTIMALVHSSATNQAENTALMAQEHDTTILAKSDESRTEDQAMVMSAISAEAIQQNTLKDETTDFTPKADQQKRQKKERGITLGVFAGSYFNYAEGSQASINTGFGVTSDIKVSKRLNISTGVSLAQNSLKFEQSIPQDATVNFARTGNKDNFDQFYSSPATSLAPVQLAINSYDAELLGFDIPVNLKYTIAQRKNTLYLSTGISSNFYIDESYTYSFGYQTTGNSVNLDAEKQTRTNRFRSFDFARVLNFSLGLDHHLNDKTRIAIEPFVKYPLSGLGAHELEFGAAGLNLKLNFTRLKK